MGKDLSIPKRAANARFHQLLENNSFLKSGPLSVWLKRVDELTDKVGGIENALYRINYVSRPHNSADSHTILCITRLLSDCRINHPECILMDPKLLESFMIFYRNDSRLAEEPRSSREGDHRKLCQLLQKNPNDLDPGPYGFSSFTMQDSEVGLRALWLWQCQLLVLSWFKNSIESSSSTTSDLTRFL